MSLVNSYHVECFCDNCQNMKIHESSKSCKNKPLKIKSIIKAFLKKMTKLHKKSKKMAAVECDYPEVDNMRNYMQDQYLAVSQEEEENRLNELREQLAVVLLVPSWNYVADCDICARGDFNPLTVRQTAQGQI